MVEFGDEVGVEVEDGGAFGVESRGEGRGEVEERSGGGAGEEAVAFWVEFDQGEVVADGVEEVVYRGGGVNFFGEGGFMVGDGAFAPDKEGFLGEVGEGLASSGAFEHSDAEVDDGGDYPGSAAGGFEGDGGAVVEEL